MVVTNALNAPTIITDHCSSWSEQALGTGGARQLIVTIELSWIGLKVECLYHADKDEDQNLTNEEDLVEGCQDVRHVLRLQLLG